VTIDEYFAAIERGLRQNVQIGTIEEPNDNTPHHPEIVTHPHHKHVGPSERVTPADQPSLSQVLDEVESYLAPS
jgi:hypothetical protein